VALWTRNLDAQAGFWQTFFGGTAFQTPCLR
jgi:hypothetical protein